MTDSQTDNPGDIPGDTPGDSPRAAVAPGAALPFGAAAASLPPGLRPGQRREATRWLSVLGVLSAGSLVGVSFSLWLVNHAPLLLVALSPLGRHMVLAAPITDPVALVTVVVVRRMLFYTASFHVGRALGVAGIEWIEQRAKRAGRFVRWLEALFLRASHLVVLVATGPTVSALAGISGMRFGVFAPLAVIGLIVRVAVVVYFAELMREPLEAILAWIDQNWIPGTVVLVSGVLLYQWWSMRGARRAE